MLADDPQERRVILDAHVADFAVDIQLGHVSPPSTAYGRHIVLAFSAGLQPAAMPVVLAVEESLAQRPGPAYAVSSRLRFSRLPKNSRASFRGGFFSSLLDPK